MKTMKDASGDTTDIYAFKDLLRKNLAPLAGSLVPKEQLIYKTMDAAINYDSSDEDKYLKSLIDSKDEKFDILKQIVNEEINKNKALSNELSEVEK